MERTVVQTYKVIKTSGFLFRTPTQREKFAKAMHKFADSTGCGLEVLSLRRGSKNRQKGSVVDIAKAIHQLIREGEENPVKALNLNRSFTELEVVKQNHFQAVQALKAHASKALIAQIDSRNLDDPATLTGLFVRESDIIHFK